MHASVTAWARRPPVWGITILGVVLTMGGIAAIPYHVRGEPLVRVLFYVFMDLCLPLGVLTSAALVARTDLEARDVTVVTRWTLATVTIVAGLYLWSRLDDVLRGAGTRSIVADLALFSSFGAAFGLTIGVNRARAAQNTRLLERTAAQQDALAFINHLLRHNVLNGLQVVNGYGDLLGEHTDETGARYLATIQERTDHMADLVGTVRVLMRTLAEGVEPAPVDCSRVVEREVSIARRGHPEAVVETDIDDDLVVQADATLGSVLENLLTNAVVHSDAAVPHVFVSASR